VFKTLNTAATGMQAQQTNMDVISNNIANVSTFGYKKSRAEFEDLLYQNVKDPGARTGENAVSPTGIQVGLGVKTGAVQRDFDVGAAKITKNPFDIMIEGAGFFPVQLPDGQIAYTRDGAFKRDPEGKLVDKNGNALQPEIRVPSNVVGVEIGAQGQVAVITGLNSVPETVGQIEIVNFVNPAGLRAIGKNLYMPSGSSGVPQQGLPGSNGMGTVAQGQIEASNVNIVEEMVNMITAQRTYESNSKAIQAADQMLQTTNNLR
jgi:flagellar basal-body rod protein FlgG